MKRNILALVIVCIVGCLHVHASDHGLEARLVTKVAADGNVLSNSFAQQREIQNEEVKFQFSLGNPTEEPITLLKWGTPLEETITQPLYVVKNQNGNKATYEGVIVDKINPFSSSALFEQARNEFMTLAPGETLTVDVDISNAYRFEPNTTYDISVESFITYFRGTFEDALAQLSVLSSQDNEQIQGSLFATSPLLVNPIQIEVSNPPRYVNRHQQNLKTNFQYCSAQQQNDFWHYRNQAVPMCSNALSYLTSRRCDNWYVTYFGRYQNTNRWQTATQHFSNICNNLQNNNFNIMCDSYCNGNSFWIAFVYPNDRTHLIHICNSMWTQQISWRAQNLLHELSHFDDVAGTRDHVYGDGNARNLAVNNPDMALNTAENHGLFSLAYPKC